MDPIRFQPILKHALWGGQRLGRELGKSVGNADDVAESWEIADLPDDVSVVASGQFQGQTLRDLMLTCPAELLGKHRDRDHFPLLVKFLDANRDLSVQVHPGPEMAGQVPGVTTGKAEMWVVLDSRPESTISVGLKPGVDRAALEAAIAAGTVGDQLNTYHVEQGEAVFLRPGTVHSLGKGLLIAEIQQPNNITFRLDDWKRLGPDGKPRELHIEQALEAINFSFGPVSPLNPQFVGNSQVTTELLNSEYFVVHQHQGRAIIEFADDDRAHVLTMIRGSSSGNHCEIEHILTGETVLLPAQRPPIHIDLGDDSVLLDSFLN